MQYIDKNALVAKIKNRIQESLDAGGATRGVYLSERMKEDSYILSFLDTLEVKEVDLDGEINKWQGYEAFPEGVDITPLPKAMEIVERTAKHFFELGLKAQKGE